MDERISIFTKSGLEIFFQVLSVDVNRNTVLTVPNQTSENYCPSIGYIRWYCIVALLSYAWPMCLAASHGFRLRLSIYICKSKLNVDSNGLEFNLDLNVLNTNISWTYSFSYIIFWYIVRIHGIVENVIPYFSIN